MADRLELLEREFGVHRADDEDDQEDAEAPPRPVSDERVEILEQRTNTARERLDDVERRLEKLESLVVAPRGTAKPSEEFNLVARCRRIEDRVKELEKGASKATPSSRR